MFIASRLRGAPARVLRTRRLPPGVAVAGLVLAGGRGTRLGGRDKGLVRVRGRPMAATAVDLLAGTCDILVISANRNLTRYAAWADVVVADDSRQDHLGPLAGISAALAAVSSRFVLTCPCDAIAIPADVPDRLLRALRVTGAADAAVLRDPERLQPLLMGVRAGVRPSIDAYLASGGRSVHGWLESVAVVEVKVRAVIGNRNRHDRAGFFS
jgi:molybdenum cofactor guanylyltransferase